MNPSLVKIRRGPGKFLAALFALQLTVLSAAAQTGSGGRPAPQPTALDAAALQDSKNLKRPSWVYDNWGIYDPIRHMPLTEEIALKQVEEIARLKRHGVRFDYYMMNAFWFERDSAYRNWDRRYWPNGPDRWIAACKAQGVTPGMWFATNLIWRTGMTPAWKDSYGGDDYRPYGADMSGALSMFEGGFLADFVAAMQHWYDRGIRVFEFDMADLNAATPASRAALSNQEIRRRNKEALIGALSAFRRKNPEAILVGFNGFKGYDKRSTDLDWLQVFETFFSGDIRVSDVPVGHYYRSMDVFNDDRVFGFVRDGVPLHRIDPCAVVLSHNVFGIYRKNISWKGTILQAVARGAWKNTVYGALQEIATEQDAQWFARVQKLYDPLLANRRTRTFGGIPGEAQPYGYVASDAEGTIYTVINPAQAVHTIALEHLLGQAQGGRILFRDAGFVPVLGNGSVTLGPGQLAVIGFGRYAGPEHDLGVQQDVVIAKAIEPSGETFRATSSHTLEVTLMPPLRGDLRIVFQQRGPDGKPLRLITYPQPTAPDAAGPIPDTGMRIEAWQPGWSLPVDQDQRTSAPGISWGLGEIRRDSWVPGRPITIRCTSIDKKPVTVEGQIYIVEY